MSAETKAGISLTDFVLSWLIWWRWKEQEQKLKLLKSFPWQMWALNIKRMKSWSILFFDVPNKIRSLFLLCYSKKKALIFCFVLCKNICLFYLQFFIKNTLWGILNVLQNHLTFLFNESSFVFIRKKQFGTTQGWVIESFKFWGVNYPFKIFFLI